MKIADMKISDYKVGRVIEEVDGKKMDNTESNS